MVCPSPADAALARAASWCRANRRADPATAGYSDAALTEQVVGLPLLAPAAASGAWWRVGTVLDTIVDEERYVWLQPSTGRVRTSLAVPPAQPVLKSDTNRGGY